MVIGIKRILSVSIHKATELDPIRTLRKLDLVAKY